MLDSITYTSNISSIIVVCDGDKDTHTWLSSFHSCYSMPIVRTLVEKQKGSVYCRNLACEWVSDGLLYATDDIVFLPGAIDICYEQFNNTFEDDDGVLGLIQNNDFNPTGMALVGIKFLERYPDKKLFFPKYFHFACQEIHWLAEKLHRFAQSEHQMVTHYHPCYYKEEIDQTHRDARVHRDVDLQLMADRKTAGLIWGDQSDV
jgi:hypothetical protein